MGMGTVIVSHVAFSVPFVTAGGAGAPGSTASIHRVEEAAMDLGANELDHLPPHHLPA
jgi:ABC-type spermidine/putrescine transport system permease subunit II